MKKNEIMEAAKRYIRSIMELLDEDIQQARKEWTDAGCPADNVWSIDLTIDGIVADYRRDMERYINHAIEAYDLSPKQAAELEKEVC